MTVGTDPPRIRERRDPAFAALWEGTRLAANRGPSPAQLARMRVALGVPPPDLAREVDAQGVQRAPEPDAHEVDAQGVQRAPEPDASITIATGHVGVPHLLWKLAAGCLIVWGLGVGLQLASQRTSRPTAPNPSDVPNAASAEPAQPRSGDIDAQPQPAAELLPIPAARPDPASPAEKAIAAGARRARRTSARPDGETRVVARDEPRTAARAAGSDPGAELSLLKRARAHARSAPHRALALVAEHEAAYPEGILREEREVIAIEALVALGDHVQAQRRAARFVREHPESAHVRRVRTLVPALDAPSDTH